MSNDYFNPPNSIWPNGLKRDGEGYVTFYPTGTNKVDISTITWPEGDKLVSPFVYQNNELVGFVDTKALTVSGSATTTMNYSHIEADFASISEGKLTVNAPNATVKKFSWAITIDSGNSGDTIVLGTKYINCETHNDIYDIEPNYKLVDIIDGVWSQDLRNLKDGWNLFGGVTNLEYFMSPLSSLEDGRGMFATFRFARLEDFDDYNGGIASAWGGFVDKLLNPESIENILTTIPEYSGDTVRYLQFCMGGYNIKGEFISNQASIDKITEITGVTCEPIWSTDPLDYTGHDILYKGWHIRTFFISKAEWFDE